MKKIFLYIILCLLILPSCTDMLQEDNKVKVSSDYVFNTPDGLRRASIALYNRERSILTVSNAGLFVALMFDAPSDIMVARTGGGVEFSRSNYESNNDLILSFWTNCYNIIGKSNEIIAGAENLGLDDPVVAQAWGEAKLFRARMYFNLYRRFGRLYLNTEPTTMENLERTFTPAVTEDIFALVNQDLDDAMSVLDWKPSGTTAENTEYGRMTRTIAKHVKAQVAMWTEDWDTAIEQCEDIFLNSGYALGNSAIENFQGENLNTNENLYVYQFSESEAGGGTVGGAGVIIGHHMSLHTTPRYDMVAGMMYSAEYGGYGWGRHYPNSHLFTLYDKAKDKRYNELFRHEYTYNDPAAANFGQVATCPPSNYVERLHPMSMKYYDKWTNATNPSRQFSFKDIVIYRLAETYLIAAEAYMHKYGGSHAKVIEYYNKTWERAGNDYFNGPITLDNILDEDARECNFEGTRWYLLKRTGKLKEKVMAHYGETSAENPLLSGTFDHSRRSFEDKHYYWPIPLSQIEMMGRENFPQTEGWE